MEQHTCGICGNSYDSKRGLNAHEGQAHPDEIWREVDCASCGETLERRRSRVERFDNQYCNDECKGDAYEDVVGKDAPQWSGGKTVLECSHCSDEFKVFTYREGEAKYCSHECYSEAITGSNSHQWKGGGALEEYGPNWPEQREKRREEDDYRCVVCGVTNEEHKERTNQSLHVHHIQRKESFRDESGELDYERANRLENLITLCYRCHNRWEGIPLRPQP